MPVTIVPLQGPHGATYNHLVSVMAPEWWWNERRACYKSFKLNMTTEKSQKSNLDTYLVLMPQGFGWCWLSSRLCFDMLYIPNNYLPQGVTGSHYYLWCLLQWDIAGFKTGSRPRTTHKKICIHSKHESTSNQPKKTFKELSLSSALFHLAIARCCLMWMLKASSKGRGANIASRVAPNEMSFGFIGGGVMPWIEVI